MIRRIVENGGIERGKNASHRARDRFRDLFSSDNGIEEREKERGVRVVREGGRRSAGRTVLGKYSRSLSLVHAYLSLLLYLGRRLMPWLAVRNVLGSSTRYAACI